MGSEGFSHVFRFSPFFLRFLYFSLVFLLFSHDKSKRLQFTGKMGNFTPTPSAPTPFRTSRTNHFWGFSLFGQFLRSMASQHLGGHLHGTCCVLSGRPPEPSSDLLKVLFLSYLNSLRTLTSLNKEVRSFFLGDKSIWSYPSVSSLRDAHGFEKKRPNKKHGLGVFLRGYKP